MLGLTSIWTNLAAVIVGSISLMGVGILFVRASNIERRGMVATVTLIGCALSVYLLVLASQIPDREVPIAAAATVISVLGFVIARAIDFALGPIVVPTVGRDPAIDPADLAD